MASHGTLSDSSSFLKKSIHDKRFTFQALLANEIGEPHTLQAFEEFLRSREHSEENLDFLNALKSLRALPSPWTSEEAKSLANQIVTTFLLTGAPKEVNCPNSIRKKVVKEVQVGGSADPDVFAAIESKIFELMRTSSFPHFVRFVDAAQNDVRPPSQGA